MLPVELSKISGMDVLALVSEGAREHERLEFKVELYKVDDPEGKLKHDARRELINDVIAFANASGGDIVIGVREESEIAVEAVGVDSDAALRFVKRLTTYWLGDIEPPLRAVDHLVILHPEDPRLAFVVIRIRRSIDAPHRSTNERHFYERVGAQKGRMSMARIRETFLREDMRSDAFDEFRAERYKKISGENHHQHCWGLLHIAPLHALSRSSRQIVDFRLLDPKNSLADAFSTNARYFSSSGFTRSMHSDEIHGPQGFHVFYDGKYEKVFGGVSERGEEIIPLNWLIVSIAQAWSHMCLIENQLGHSPVLVALTFVKTSNLCLDLPNGRFKRSKSSEVIFCPEARLEAASIDLPEFAAQFAPTLLPFFLSFGIDRVDLPLDQDSWRKALESTIN